MTSNVKSDWIHVQVSSRSIISTPRVYMSPVCSLSTQMLFTSVTRFHTHTGPSCLYVSLGLTCQYHCESSTPAQWCRLYTRLEREANGREWGSEEGKTDTNQQASEQPTKHGLPARLKSFPSISRSAIPSVPGKWRPARFPAALEAARTSKITRPRVCHGSVAFV